MPASFCSRMHSLTCPLSTALPLLLLVGLAGCGGDEDLPTTVPVSGKVTFQGKALKEGTVMFHPQEGDGKGHPATGQIGEDGTYTLTTFDQGDGATLGKHIVTVEIFPKGANPGFEAEAAEIQLPQKYTSPKTSDLIVEVKADTETLDLELTEK